MKTKHLKYIPLFDFNETTKIALEVGFNPKTPGLAQKCLIDTQSCWTLPTPITDQEKFQAHFYLALGLFIHLKYVENEDDEENDDGIPDSIINWYERNTALSAADTLFVEVDTR